MVPDAYVQMPTDLWCPLAAGISGSVVLLAEQDCICIESSALLASGSNLLLKTGFTGKDLTDMGGH